MVLITIGLGFAMVEGTVRLMFSGPDTAKWGQFHEERGWSLARGDYMVEPPMGLGAFPITISELGLRSHRLPAASRNSRQLLVLGDSFTFAREVRTEKIFTRQLEERMEERFKVDLDVLNAGVPGYGTAQELLFMRELLQSHRVRPDLVVLIFFTNDILDNLCLSYANLAPQPSRPCFTLRNDALYQTQRPQKKIDSADDTLGEAQTGGGLMTVALARALGEQWIQQKPGLVQFLDRLGVNVEVPRMPGLLNGWYRDDVLERGVPLTGALIKQIKQETEAAGSRLVVSMVPSPFQIYPDTYAPLLKRSFEGDPIIDRFIRDPQRPQKLVAEICREADIPFQDLMPTFLEHNAEPLFIPRDGHLTEHGHDLMAPVLFDFVARHFAEHQIAEHQNGHRESLILDETRTGKIQ
jgi:lysophospholipase L1-like esterase